MIKRIVHIDQDFPRRFSEQANKTLSKMNWGFDTQADTDDINGNIYDLSDAAGTLTQDDVNNSTHVNQLYDNMQLTQNQRDNLVAHSDDGKQIRFNANVFNYIVHTEIDNIVLKYDAAVAYAEGKENNWTGEFAWKEKYLVVDGHNYNITFDILLHDPIGIDAYCYEAYVRNTCVIQTNRDHGDTDPTNTTPVTHTYATFTDADHAESQNGNPPTAGSFITAQCVTNKLQDPYQEGNDRELSFKLSIKLSGQGYDTNYINTSEEHYTTWKQVIDNPESTEEEIIAAWTDCEGIKFKFFDVAGNVTFWVMPYVEIAVITVEELRNLKKLLLEFINTNPADLQLGTDLIGRTTIKVTNPNYKLSDCDILINLDEASLGDLYRNTRKETFIVAHNKHIAKVATEDVGNIDDSGWVIAHAELDIPEFDGDDFLDSLRVMVRNLTRADGSLGEWIKECSDNLRKITLDPFVPQYLKETTNKNSAYYKFVKFTERYLNTMFKAYDKNCYISVLEAIARIGNFNDYTTIYGNLLDKYDNDHGDMLHITTDELTALIDLERQDVEEDET